MKKKSWDIILGVLMFIVVLIVIGLWIWYGDLLQTHPTPVIQNNPKEINQEMSALLGNSGIKFTLPISETSTATTSLPGNLQGFVLANALGEQAFQLDYGSSQGGYKMMYLIPSSTISAVDLALANSALLSKKGWVPTNGAQATYFGYINFKKETATSTTVASVSLFNRNGNVQVVVQTMSS
jgi:hypothetical protein